MLYKKYHIPLIIKGIKRATRRDWKRNHAKPGGVYGCQVYFCQPYAECEVMIKAARVFKQRLGDMTEEDADKEGGYTLEVFKQRWEEINGKPFDPTLVVTVIEWDEIVIAGKVISVTPPRSIKV